MVEYLDALDAAPQPVPIEQRMLAALGPKMLRLSATRAVGSHPYLVTPAHTAEARTVMGPDAVLAPEQKVVLSTESTQAREIARKSLAIYLTLPNYLRNLERLGFTQDDFADRGSDRLVDALVAWGSADTVAARVREHRDAGADHVAIQVLDASTDPTQGRLSLPRREWAELAATLGL
jgi:probable F420-dependent oxidoreductase